MIFNSYSLRTLIHFLLIGLAPLHLYAQEAEVFMGPESRLERRSQSFDFLGADKEKFYLWQRSGSFGALEMEAYDLDSLNKLWAKEIPVPDFGDGELELLEVKHTGNAFLMLHSLRKKSSGERQLFLTPLNEEGEVADLPVNGGTIPPVTRKENLHVGLELSPDSLQFLLYYSLTDKANEEEAYELRVYNKATLQQLDRKTLVLPYRNEFLDIDDVLVDNSGKVYMLSGIKPDKRPLGNSQMDDNNKRYLLFTFDFEQNKLKEFDVNLKDKWVAAVTCGITREGRLAIGGFYSNDMYFSVGGTFYFTIDTDNWSVMSKSMQPFDKEFLRSFGSNRLAGGGRELYDYYFDHFVLSDDGTATLVAEQYYMSERWFIDPGTGRQSVSYSYNYNDIIVVKVDSSGDVNWSRRIPKSQVTINDNGPFSSYALTTGEESINIVFNDNPRNYDLMEGEVLEDPASFGNLKKSIVTRVRIGEKGKMTREPLFTAKESETVFKPKTAFSPGNNDLIVFSQLRKNFRFIRLRF